MISVRIIKDSISGINDRITTWELVYPRFIHSELMTHRMFSRNAASSRAIPIDKMIDMVMETPAMPIHWGMNQTGMQAKEVHSLPDTCIHAWGAAATSAVFQAVKLQKLGLHKQIVNRVLEPFQWMKTIVTATEYANWYALRNHPDAQPEIARVAELMQSEYDRSEPQRLVAGQYHMPYVETYVCPEYGNIFYSLDDEDLTELSVEDALKISASCCAQVSYRMLDQTVEKALKIYDALVNQRPVHASPFEHQAMAMTFTNALEAGYEGRVEAWQDGITHMDKYHNLWSGNFKGWIQSRQLIKDNVVEG